MHDTHHKHPHGGHGDEPISVPDKLKKLAEHWIGHNEEHAGSYRLWADRAREAGLDETGSILDQLADRVADQNKMFQRIITLLGPPGDISGGSGSD